MHLSLGVVVQEELPELCFSELFQDEAYPCRVSVLSVAMLVEEDAHCEGATEDVGCRYEIQKFDSRIEIASQAAAAVESET